MFPDDVRAEILSSVMQYTKFSEPVMQADNVGDGAAAAAAHDSHHDDGCYGPLVHTELEYNFLFDQ